MTSVQIPTEDHLGALIVGPAALSDGKSSGPLAGMTGVVKDLFDIQGFRTGAGNPDFLADAAPAETSAPAVQRFIDAGVSVIGKSITDELAFSLAGTNKHYGTPHNTAAPGRIPGGSSSGSASAVAGGLADVALGTDTGGSVRVPSSWCGLFGIRPTHGRIPIDGVVPLASSFDTVGWFARSGQTLRTLGRVMLADSSEPTEVIRVLVANDLLALTDPDVHAGLRSSANEIAERLTGRAPQAVHVVPESEDLDEWFYGFRIRQQWEAWQAHGQWVTERQPDMGPDIAGRFVQASQITTDEVVEADLIRERVRDHLQSLVGEGTILILPTTMGPAPEPTPSGPEADKMRARMLAVNSIAGSTGSPTVAVPAMQLDGHPVGLGLLGRPGSDCLLLDAAATLD
ncbi:MAG: amidase [Ilumatobacter sp.]|jgi:amidase